jgi:protein-disulfide isomerase
MEQASGIAIAAAFQISGLEQELKAHTRYARQNGVHTSPTFMVNGLINPDISSGATVDEWLEKIFGAK